MEQGHMSSLPNRHQEDISNSSSIIKREHQTSDKTPSRRFDKMY